MCIGDNVPPSKTLSRTVPIEYQSMTQLELYGDCCQTTVDADRAEEFNLRLHIMLPVESEWLARVHVGVVPTNARGILGARLNAASGHIGGAMRTPVRASAMGSCPSTVQGRRERDNGVYARVVGRRETAPAVPRVVDEISAKAARDQMETESKKSDILGQIMRHHEENKTILAALEITPD